MSFTEAITSAFTNYCCFTGRARRSEYWYFLLLNMIVALILAILPSNGFFTVIGYIWSLGTLLPGLGLCVRRLHDIGREWYALFIVLIPLVGEILLIVWMAKDGEPYANRFGPSPKDGYTVY